MKTILLSIFLVLTTNIFSQSTDLLYIPDQKTLVVTYNNYSSCGFYVGGYLVSSVSNYYIYTTPISFLNRIGLNFTYKNKISIMGGVFVKNYVDSLSLKPDVWLKVNPLRTILKVEKGPDFSFAINYNQKFRYAIGLSLNFW